MSTFVWTKTIYKSSDKVLLIGVPIDPGTPPVPQGTLDKYLGTHAKDRQIEKNKTIIRDTPKINIGK